MSHDTEIFAVEEVGFQVALDEVAQPCNFE